MADSTLKRRIRDSFRREYVHRPDESVRVSDGFGDNVHVEVVSHSFDGLDLVERHRLTRAFLQHQAEDVWGAITLVDEISPEELVRANGRRRTKRA
jgi:stress-induced morphogen